MTLETRKLIPKYQVMPDLSDEDYQALKKDIQERGVMVPIEYDEDGNILDGHHRLRICYELGLKDFPKIVREGLSEPDKRTHARQLNMARRHLTREQRQKMIQEQLTETPEKSDRQIAADLGVSDKTVGAKRKKLESRAEIPHVEVVVDTLGREQQRVKFNKDNQLCESHSSIGATGKERPRQVQRREEPTEEVESEQLDIDEMIETNEPQEITNTVYPPSLLKHDLPTRDKEPPTTSAKIIKMYESADEIEQSEEKISNARDKLSLKVFNELADIYIKITAFEVTNERMEALLDNYYGDMPVGDQIRELNQNISKLQEIKNFFIRKENVRRGIR